MWSSSIFHYPRFHFLHTSLFLLLFLNQSHSIQSAEHESGPYVTSDGVKFQVETVASGLDVPWSLAFDGDDLYFTERGGQLRHFKTGDNRPSVVAKIMGVHNEGEGGLMGLALHPHFKSNRILYLSFTYQDGGGVGNKVVKCKLTRNGVEILQTIVDRLPGSGIHNGCRIKFGPDGKLYITTGDAAKREIAQDLASPGGKVLRLNDDGTIPSDNPFPQSAVYSLGHRNGQGLAWHPTFKTLFETEHGPSGFDGPGGGDEVNFIEAGKNYGWPVIHHKKVEQGMLPPAAEFTPAVAPSGATFCSGRLFERFKGDFFVATLRGKSILRIKMNNTGTGVTTTEALLVDVFGRLRDVVEGPDGSIYFCTNNRDGRGSPQKDDDRILRIVPVR